jgi:carboxymethylenebutenolidase
MGRRLAFQRPDGKESAGYYVGPAAAEKAPGVVVIQEWWGLNDQIRGVADALAHSGYRALVPDLFRGKVTVEAAEAEHLMTNLDFLDAAKQDVRGAVQHLRQTGRKVGVMGFCMGGALAILAAIHVPEADAVVCWYGVPPEEAGDPRTIRAPVQGHFALEDAFFPGSQVEKLATRLREAKVKHEFHWYKAQHAFGNETGPYHEPEAKKLAWQRSLDFLARHLES